MMKRSSPLPGVLALVLAFPLFLPAQPDVIVGDLTGPRNFGSTQGKTAYSVGTTSCNVGTTPLVWISNTPQHPVIGQNMYRLKNGRFEQIGQSWLKHGFTALQQTLCGPCNANPNGNALGVGCSDPYSAGLNGQQGGLGPRFEVNPASGTFPYPFTSPPINTILDRRIQVDNVDLSPAQNANARYFAEGQYIHPDDAQAGNGNNNASYREFSVTNSSYDLAWNGVTVRMQPAIYAWQAADPSVNIQTVDVPNDGRFIVAWKTSASTINVGLTHYEFAIFNLNSHLAAGSVDFAFPCASAVIRTPSFHDVDYHSGEPFQNTDWTTTISPNNIRFGNGQNFTTNPNANALRWGTLYNFAFDADSAPGSLSLNLWRPNSLGSVTLNLGGGASSGPEYQVNGFAIRADVNGVLGTASVPATLNLSRNQSANFNITSIGTGQPWEVLYGQAPLVPRSACALTTLDNQVINLDVTDPALGLWWNTFQSPPFTNVTLPFSIPFASTVAVQTAILNPSVPSGLSISQATRVTVQ